MDGKRLIEKIKLRNILSFGDKGEEIELQPLNVIIGPNASGKSNLVDIIKFLRSLTQQKGLINFLSRNGGIAEWIWKGTKEIDNAFVQIQVNSENKKIRYQIQFAEVFQRLDIINEIVENLNENIVIDRNEQIPAYKSRLSVGLEKEIIIIEEFILTDLLYFTHTYTDLNTNRSAEIRRPQVPDAPNNFLEEDGSNLALVLNDLEHRGDTKDKIVENLKRFNPRIKDYSVRILGGTVQLFIREEGLEKPISAMRLSDGTLRYLCLLAILCHPEPPPLICIEEPETGLHPDILPTIAELMKEASQRTQLIVTTHSDILISAFSDLPEAVLVCEKDEDGTHFRRLEADKLKVWLEEYTLGEAWLRGAFGGTRW
jgi:predicted ATPase